MTVLNIKGATLRPTNTPHHSSLTAPCLSAQDKVLITHSPYNIFFKETPLENPHFTGFAENFGRKFSSKTSKMHSRVHERRYYWYMYVMR